MSAAAPAPPAAAAAPHLGVIGLGLIGASLALAVRRAGWRVSAYNRTAASARAAAAAGCIDHCAERIQDLGGCDIIFIAVPMSAYDSALGALAPALAAGSVVTDGGSVKGAAAAAARRQLGERARRFVPAHPIAGKEQSGWQAASADLFDNHLAILCPEDSDADAAAAVTNMWRQAGARTCELSVAEHDRHLAVISHLPHILAYALVSEINARDSSGELLRFAAGGFRDFTRIAGSHPDMWRDICLANAGDLLEAIAGYQRMLAEFADCIRQEDGDSLFTRLESARAMRRQWINTLEQ